MALLPPRSLRLFFSPFLRVFLRALCVSAMKCIPHASSPLAASALLRPRHPFLLRRLPPRHREVECRPAPDLRLHPDPSTAPLHDPLADRQPHPRPRVRSPMQPFEHTEDLFLIPRVDPDPVVLHRKQPVLLIQSRR